MKSAALSSMKIHDNLKHSHTSGTVQIIGKKTVHTNKVHMDDVCIRNIEGILQEEIYTHVCCTSRSLWYKAYHFGVFIGLTHTSPVDYRQFGTFCDPL